VIEYPSNSVHKVCLGDEVIIICNSPFNSLVWKWQNESVECMKYMPVGFPGVPGVNITLLTLDKGSGSTNSSLQFIVSEEFVEARVYCNNYDYRDIILAAGKCVSIISTKKVMNVFLECMLKGTRFHVDNVVINLNTTSFYLMWTTNIAYNSSYFLILSANSENLWNISTNESFVNLNLNINISYSVDIYYEVNATRKKLIFLKM